VDQEGDLLEAFASSAAQLLRGVDHRARWRVLRETEAALDRSFWRGLAEAGWLSLLLSESDGGLGLGMRSVAALSQAVGEHLAPEPYALAGVRAAMALGGLPASALRSRLMGGFAQGDLLIGVAWQERAGTLEVRAGNASVRTVGDAWRLDGIKCFVEPSSAADGWLVAASDAGEPVLLWVPATSCGVSIANDRRVDGGVWATLSFDGVPVPADHLLMRGPQVLALLERADDAARVAQSAELLGVARRALGITLDYMRLRTQFGKAIGSFQALQHRMVDAKLQIELAAAALEDVLQRDFAALGCAERARCVSRLKSRCADAAIHVTRLCIQMHGAMGYTDECDIGLYYKRALVLNAALGNAQAQRRRFFRLSVRRSSAAPALDSADSDAPLPPGTDWDALDETRLRLEVRRFLAAHYPPALRHLPRDANWAQVSDWNAVLLRQGWVAPSWPKAHGGMGLSPGKLIAFQEEFARYGVARFISNGLVMLGPLLIRFGTPDQRAHHLPRILSGEDRWAQGYSEPDAGSDLASLNTHARIEGDMLVINGRKIWTSYALECTHMFALVRTARTERPGDGISFVLLDLQTPGVTVRGIRNLGLDAKFAEVTFDEARVPLANLVGELNGGWSLAKALLGHERLFSGEPSPVLYVLSQLTVLAEQRALFEDGGFAERHTQLALDALDLQALYDRFAAVVKRGGKLGPDVSLLKIWATETRQRACAFLSEAAEESGVNLEPQRVGEASLSLVAPMLASIPASIASGTNEVMRNIVARQVLGLPPS
jgi:alkylation response protein AidB-like acyl-CoA dehydrogenase